MGGDGARPRGGPVEAIRPGGWRWGRDCGKGDIKGTPGVWLRNGVAGPIYWDRVYRSVDRYRQRSHSFVV